MAHITVKVPPLSRKQIRDITTSLRQDLRWEEGFFPIVEVIEHVFPLLDDDFTFVIETVFEMGDEHGRTFPDEKTIVIREDVYEGACDGFGRDRMTMAHELGHLILHEGIPLSRRVSRDTIPPFESSEWQANCFGGELLIPATHIHLCEDTNDASIKFGVSHEAAEFQWRKFKEERLIK